jgi:hypothetical protein
VVVELDHVFLLGVAGLSAPGLSQLWRDRAGRAADGVPVDCSSQKRT